jgi:hypothetical protein
MKRVELLYGQKVGTLSAHSQKAALEKTVSVLE